MNEKEPITEKIGDKSRLFSGLQKVYERFVKIRGEPRKIALGFALGLFIGMSPTMGFQIAIAVFFAALLKWNKISSAVGVWITNPVTAPFLYGLTYFTGAKLLGIRKAYTPPEELSITAIEKLIQKAPEALWALIIGGIVLGLPLAVAGYYFSYSAILKYQGGIKRKIVERREKLTGKRGKTGKRMNRKSKKLANSRR